MDHETRKRLIEQYKDGYRMVADALLNITEEELDQAFLALELIEQSSHAGEVFGRHRVVDEIGAAANNHRWRGGAQWR